MTQIAEPAAPSRASLDEQVGSLRSRRGRTVLGGLSVAHFAHHVTNSLLNPLLPFIRDTFALSYAESGLAVSAFSLSNGLANGPLGVLADRIGHRAVIAGGLVGIGLVSVALAASGAYWQLLVLLVAMGIMSGTYHAPAAAVIGRVFAPSVRGAAMGLHITAGHLSFFAVPLVAGVVATAGSWRIPYAAFALAPIVSGIAVWRLAPSARVRGPSGLLGAFAEIGTVARTVGPLVSLSIVAQVGLGAVYGFLALYLVDARGVAPGVAAALFAFPQLAGMFGAPLGGALSDRFGRRTVLLVALTALGPAVYALTVVPTELVLAPLLAIGLFFAMRAAATETLIMDSAPADRRASVLGAYYLVNAEIGGIGAPVLGIAAGVFGLGVSFGWVGAGLVGLSLVALLIATFRH